MCIFTHNKEASISLILLGTNQRNSDCLSAVDAMWPKKEEEGSRSQRVGLLDEGWRRRDESTIVFQSCWTKWRRERHNNTLFKVISYASVTALWRKALCSLGGKEKLLSQNLHFHLETVVWNLKTKQYQKSYSQENILVLWWKKANWKWILQKRYKTEFNYCSGVFVHVYLFMFVH